MNEGGRSRGRIGVFVPASNVNLEPDVGLLLPAGVTAHFMRIGGYDPSAVADSSEMQALGSEGLDDAAVRMLASAGVGVMAYGCTSGTFSLGREFDDSLKKRISAAAGGIPTVTAASALIEALEVLGVSRVAFASPYVPELNERAVAFLAAFGIQVVSSASPDDRLTSIEQRELSPESAYALACRADAADAEAIVISCTDFRALEVIPRLERDRHKPVVSSNSALMHASLARISADTREIDRGGQLFTHTRQES